MMSASTGTAGSRASASARLALRRHCRPLAGGQRPRDVPRDNCYYLPAVEIVSQRLRTHSVSNTAFRGFGGPQGMIAIERVMDAIASALGRDPLEIRTRNLYGLGRDVTPYHMRVTDNVAPELIAELAERAGYEARRGEVEAFNAGHTVLKKGLALTPVKFGISFTTTHLNQAGALVLVYADGSCI
jgi:xanthine dehydrogenase large subunit